MRPQEKEKLMKGILWLNGLLTVVILLVILFYILSRGLSMINWEFLTDRPRKMGAEGGIFPAIVGTVYFVIVTMAVATPLGIGTAVFLAEYAPSGLFSRWIRFGVNVLAGIPSIIYGLFGFAFFVMVLKPLTGGWSILSGALTAALMMLPVLVRSTEEAIKALPRSYIEGSLALGATKWQTVTGVILPAAMPGILTGVILGVGRVVGETAALLTTLGGSVLLPTSVFDPARTLAMHIYLVAMEVGAMDMAFGAAAVLISVVLAINLTARLVLRSYTKV